MPTRYQGSLLLVATFSLSATAMTPGERCASLKIRAGYKKAAAKAECYRRAVAVGVAVDANCLGRADAKFTAAFSAAEQAGGCATTADAGAIETKVDAFVADLVSELPATTSTTTTTTTTSTTTTTEVTGCCAHCSPANVCADGFPQNLCTWDFCENTAATFYPNTLCSQVAGCYQACGALIAPQCDGICPSGQFCAGAPCTCVSGPISCGDGTAGPPECWGTCPVDTQVCTDVGGSCQCQ